jgi:hypothetical protein
MSRPLDFESCLALKVAGYEQRARVIWWKPQKGDPQLIYGTYIVHVDDTPLKNTGGETAVCPDAGELMERMPEGTYLRKRVLGYQAVTQGSLEFAIRGLPRPEFWFNSDSPAGALAKAFVHWRADEEERAKKKP